MKFRLMKTDSVEVISSLFILIFVYTAASKYSDIERFKWAMGESPLIGKPLNVPLAYLIPAFELIIAGLLFFHKFRKIGLYASLILMGLFTVYIAILFSFFDKLPCSCGGIFSTLRWSEHLILNSILTVIAAIGVWLHKKHLSGHFETHHIQTA